MTERLRSQIQAPEMSFLCRVSGLSLRDRERSSGIREELEHLGWANYHWEFKLDEPWEMVIPVDIQA